MEDPPDIYQVLKRMGSKLPVCRVCLNLSMEYIELESTLCLANNAEVTYADAFRLIMPTQIELCDWLPKTVCSSCGSDLLSAFLFRKRVENANIILNKICRGEISSRIQSLDYVQVKKESDEYQHLNLLEESMTIGQDNVDIFSKDPVEDLPKECTNFEKLWSSSPRSSLFVESDSESTTKESNGLNESIKRNTLYCEEECTTQGILHIHRTKNQLSNYDDSRCEKLFVAIDEHLPCNDIFGLESVDFKKSELNVVGKDDGYSCKSCSKKFHTKHLLRWHTSRFHKKPITKTELKIEKKEKCPVCFKMVRKSFMEVHKEVHFGPSNSMCTECGKQFSSRLALRTHTLIHKQSGEFLCHICNKMCLTKYALKSHIQFKHIADKSSFGKKKFKYQCEDCGLIFQYPSKLKVHQRKHNAETPFICPHCSRSYLRKDQFNIHMRYHNNDLPYKCNQCHKSYATKNNLSEHRKSVHDNVTYSCDKCEQTFKSVTGLRKHKFVHTGYPYVCPICGLGQSFRSGIKAHLLRVHKDTFTEEEFNETFPIVVPKSGFRRPKY